MPKYVITRWPVNRRHEGEETEVVEAEDFDAAQTIAYEGAGHGVQFEVSLAADAKPGADAKPEGEKDPLRESIPDTVPSPEVQAQADARTSARDEDKDARKSQREAEKDARKAKRDDDKDARKAEKASDRQPDPKTAPKQEGVEQPPPRRQGDADDKATPESKPEPKKTERGPRASQGFIPGPTVSKETKR